MKKMLLVLPIVILLACNSTEDTHDNKDVNFFPISGNINAELRELDSLPIAIIKYVQQSEKQDTVITSKREVRDIAEDMTVPDISSPELKKYFVETVFYDKTSNTLTMSYTTTSEKPVIRKIDVIISQETDKVRSIYVEKLEKRADTLINKRMVWTPGKNVQVIAIANVSGQPERVTTTRYQWGMQ